MKVSRLPIESIRLDGGTQVRERLDSSRVDEYAEYYPETGASPLPPVEVFYDGECYWCADGFHRIAGAKKAGRKRISVTVHAGTRRDAVLYAAGANATHGLPRSNADKRRAVLLLLNDAEWSQCSDRWIADKCGVGNKMVGDVRRQMCSEHTSTPSTRTGKDGKSYPATKPSARASAERAGAAEHAAAGQHDDEGEGGEEQDMLQAQPKTSRRERADAMDEQISSLVAEGLPPYLIAARVGCSASKVHETKRRLGLGGKAGPLDPVISYAREFTDTWSLLHRESASLWDDASEADLRQLSDALAALTSETRALARLTKRKLSERNEGCQAES